nr:hypothetical protein CFP56_56907 [Quercus suber]
MAAWLPSPVMFDSSREFDCDGFDTEQCQYYKHSWRNWYVADWTFALPTVAFFMSTIGVFTIAYVLSQLLALSSKSTNNSILRRGIAAARYLSYRGFHIERVGWSSAPVGVLLLGVLGTVYFFCTFDTERQFSVE